MLHQLAVNKHTTHSHNLRAVVEDSVLVVVFGAVEAQHDHQFMASNAVDVVVELNAVFLVAQKLKINFILVMAALQGR